MKSYFPFLSNYRKAIYLAPLLVIVDVICEIVQPELMSKIVDVGVKQKSLPYILHIGMIMLILSLIAIAANVGNVYFSSRTSVGFAAELRKGIFTKIQTFSFSNLDKFGSASLVTRLTNDVNILQDLVMMMLRLLIRAPLMLLFAVFFAIRINAGLAIIIAIAIPLLSLSIYFLLHRGLPYFEKMQAKLDIVTRVIQENLINVRVVKSFVRENYENKQFDLASGDLRAMAVKASGIVVLIMPVMQLVMNISIVAIIWFGGVEIISGHFQVGQLMSFITYITQILMSLMMLAMSIMTFSRAGASSKRILEVLNQQPDILDSDEAILKNRQPQKGKIEFRKVYFKYQEQSPEFVLKDISFTASPGETIAIIGSTGSSKSTLVQLIPRLYEVTGGQILIDGADIREYTLENLRNRVALVLQKNELFSGTIAQNLRWGNPQATQEQIMTAAKIAQAHEFIMSLPEKYESVLGQNGVNVSGGQKQRLCIARSLLKNPLILILDDSTSALDIQTEANVRAALKSNSNPPTMLIIAQRISSIRSADRILLLENGEINGIGTHEELIHGNKIYQEIYHSQQLV